jgi:hypothetical protein
MSVITGAQLKTVSDSIAKQKNILDVAVGAIATADSILYGIQACITNIASYAEDVVNDCHTAFVNEKNSMPNFKLAILHKAIKSLENHIRRLEGEGISDYWETENYPTYRIAPEFVQLARAIGLYMKPAICFPPVTAMGSFVASGAEAGVFTDGSAIDGNLYGPGDCELEVTAKGGASVSIVATITGTDENGAVVTGVGTFSADDVGDKVDVVPDQVGKQFQDITNITITGGVADDAFTIQSKVDRAVSL